MIYASETLVEGGRNPIFDACRALLARGITGRLEVWRPARQTPICKSILNVAPAWQCGNRKNTVCEPWRGARAFQMPFPRVPYTSRRPFANRPVLGLANENGRQ